MADAYFLQPTYWRGGRLQRFFHYMWGYLLPALAEAHRISQDCPHPCRHFVMVSCGPHLDRGATELFDRLGLELTCADARVAAEDTSLEQIEIQRWDLLSMKLWAVRTPRLSRKRLRYLRRSVPVILHYSNVKSELRERISRVRNWVIPQLTVGSPIAGDLPAPDQYLVLKRSPPPPLPATDSSLKHVFRTYGTESRSLQGVEEAAAELQSRGNKIEVFEPGKYTLVDQIRVFANCRGIIGIRGSEFANQIWLKPGSPVVMISPHSMGPAELQQTLPWLLDLDYHELTTDDKHPTLQADDVAGYLVK